jgi:hypothetical protein
MPAEPVKSGDAMKSIKLFFAGDPIDPAIHGSLHQNEQFKAMMQDSFAGTAVILPYRLEPAALALE